VEVKKAKNDESKRRRKLESGRSLAEAGWVERVKRERV
jgi:hypothetical protein